MVETQLPPAGDGPLVLDIGGDVGALIVYAAAEREGSEVHICPAGHRDVRTHNVVRARRLGERRRFAAVFPALESGEYLVLPAVAGPSPLPVTIVGGAVAEAEWPAQPSSGGTHHHG